jgi:spore coat polysaccharide biosynthesis protein SpsF
MEALRHIPADTRVLACPEDCVQSFAPLAAEAGFELLSGPKEDVLERYCIAIRRYHIRQVIRATGDNPFVFTDAAAAITAEALALGADYAGYSGLPLGAGVESVNAAALLRAEAEAAAPHEREHVCPYLYGHPELFRLHRPLAPLRWCAPDKARDSVLVGQCGTARAPLNAAVCQQTLRGEPAIRLTVDTAADYEKAQELYAALNRLANSESRYQGPAIIDLYKEIFSDPENAAQNSRQSPPAARSESAGTEAQ